MNPLSAADKYLLAKAENFGWTFEEEKKRNSFWLAKGCVFVAAIIVVIIFLQDGWLESLTVGVLVIPGILVSWLIIGQIEIRTGANMKGLNPLRSWWPMRAIPALSFLFPMDGFTWTSLLWLLYGLMSLAGTYFASCNSKPSGWKPPKKTPWINLRLT